MSYIITLFAICLLLNVLLSYCFYHYTCNICSLMHIYACFSSQKRQVMPSKQQQQQHNNHVPAEAIVATSMFLLQTGEATASTSGLRCGGDGGGGGGIRAAAARRGSATSTLTLPNSAFPLDAAVTGSSCQLARSGSAQARLAATRQGSG